MWVHPQFNPIAFSVGPLSVHWYGLMYLVGFAFFYLLGRIREKEKWRGLSGEDALEDLLFYGILGVVLGGRIGYCFLYQPSYFIQHPLEIFAIWQGGMSVHGGMIGCLLAMLYFKHRHGVGLLKTADFVTPLVPVGLFFGRIGNFINGELWGRVTTPDFPFAMIFPESGTMQARHPSQLYEAGLEGIVLFCVMWFFSRRQKPEGAVTGLFCLGYGIIRFCVEFVREPDSFLGLRALGLSQGQWLSLPLILLGIFLIVRAYRVRR